MISIPCGLHIYDREIELEVRPTLFLPSELLVFHDGKHIGKISCIPEIEAAIKAALNYKRSIEDVGIDGKT